MMFTENRKGVFRLLIFVLILLILVLPFLTCGELLRAATVAKIQQHMGKEFLYGTAYSNNYSHYKYQVLKQRKPKILAMGDSRTLQIKGDFFKHPENFYNAGMLTVSLDANINALLNFPKELLPQTLILCMDQSFFTQKGVEDQRYFDEPSFLKKEDYQSFNILIRRMADDRRKDKFHFWNLLWQPNKIGVLAKTKEFGFKQDGSYYYGDVYQSKKTGAERTAVDLDRIRKGEGWFAGGEHVYSKTVERVQALIDFCKSNKIHLIAYTPPFSQSAMQIYKTRKDVGFLKEIDPVVGQMIRNAGFEFYDYTDPSKLSLTDENFIDAFHGSDVAYCLMLRDMLHKNSKTSQYIDAAKLEKLYQNRVSEIVLEVGM